MGGRGGGSSAVQALWDGGGRGDGGVDVTARSEVFLIRGSSRRFERRDVSRAVQSGFEFLPNWTDREKKDEAQKGKPGLFTGDMK